MFAKITIHPKHTKAFAYSKVQMFNILSNGKKSDTNTWDKVRSHRMTWALYWHGQPITKNTTTWPIDNLTVQPHFPPKFPLSYKLHFSEFGERESRQKLTMEGEDDRHSQREESLITGNNGGRQKKIIVFTGTAAVFAVAFNFAYVAFKSYQHRQKIQGFWMFLFRFY